MRPLLKGRAGTAQLDGGCRDVINWGLIHFACSISHGWRFRHIWGMMKTAKLAFGSGIIVRGVAFREGRWVVAAEGRGTRSCPGCGETSRSRHSWQVRRLQDLPIQGVPTTLELRSRRWKCRNEQCARKTFVEKLAIALPFARKTRQVGELDQAMPYSPPMIEQNRASRYRALLDWRLGRDRNGIA
jgi:hypothetical protein